MCLYTSNPTIKYNLEKIIHPAAGLPDVFVRSNAAGVVHTNRFAAILSRLYFCG